MLIALITQPPIISGNLFFTHCLFHSGVAVIVTMSKVTVEKVELGSDRKTLRGKFPKSVPFILCNVFFERFCSGGIFGEL